MADGVNGITITDLAPPPETKRPLYRELPPAPEFPIAALGTLRHAAEALHLSVQASLAMCAQSALAAATLAIQPHYDVDLPCGRRPLTGLFVSIAESGERKTSVDRLALRSVRAAEQQLAASFDAEKQGYANDREAWEAARATAKKRAKAAGWNSANCLRKSARSRSRRRIPCWLFPTRPRKRS